MSRAGRPAIRRRFKACIREQGSALDRAIAPNVPDFTMRVWDVVEGLRGCLESYHDTLEDRGLYGRRVIAPPRHTGPQEACDRMRKEFDQGVERMTTLKAEIKGGDRPRLPGIKLVNGIRRQLVATRKVARKHGCRWPRKVPLPSGMAVPKKKPSSQLPLPF